MPSLVERIWWTAHATSWAPRWELFQLLAIVAGAVVVARARDVTLLRAFACGVVSATVGAAALGSGGAWATYLGSGARGPSPELEVAGFGAIGGLVVGYVIAARLGGSRKRNAWVALDVVAPAIGAMIVLARLGCFFAGCDFGTPSTAPWALRYPAHTPAFRAQLDAGLLGTTDVHTLPVHPTQLYEAMAGVAVIAVTVMWPRRITATLRGARFGAAIVTYAVARFAIDIVRGDLARGAFGLTTTQWLSLAMVTTVSVAWSARSQVARRRVTPPRRSAQLSGKPS